MEEGSEEKAILMSALVVEKEGLDFYSKVSKVAADPRARHLFREMAERKLEEMRLLETPFTRLLGNQMMANPEEAKRLLQADGRPVPAVYPRKSLDTAVCFVCGEEVPVDRIPDECPSCGASRYAFERDIDEATALKMIKENEARCLEFYRESLKEASGEARTYLEDLLRRTEERIQQLSGIR